VRAWTDYPILPLGDESGKAAPIREVRVLGWDGNKYAAVEVEGLVVSLKRGYLYSIPGRYNLEGTGWTGEDGRAYADAPTLTGIPLGMPEDYISC